MSGFKRNGLLPSLPSPQPKSPPRYPDLYGKRRELARVQMLEREIGFLEEELKSVERIPPASRSCKEVADFVTANVDPLILTTNKTRRSCRFWKWLCGVCCLDVSWMCCCSCSWRPRCPDCTGCGMPKWEWWKSSSQCCKKWKCSCVKECCCCSMPEWSWSWSWSWWCPSGCCSSCTCSPKCPNINICSCCRKSCCFPCYYCI